MLHLWQANGICHLRSQALDLLTMLTMQAHSSPSRWPIKWESTKLIHICSPKLTTDLLYYTHFNIICIKSMNCASVFHFSYSPVISFHIPKSSMLRTWSIMYLMGWKVMCHVDSLSSFSIQFANWESSLVNIHS